MKKILTIGGSDPFAGGGIQSDLKTFENYHVSPEWLEQQLFSIDQMVNLDGIKIGLLNSMAAIDVVTEFVKRQTDIPIVLDPVLAFKETDDLAQDTYSKHLVDHLFPLADVVTPNLKEAALLTGKNDSFQLEEIRKMAKEIYGTSLSKSVANSKKYVYQCIINGVMMNDGTGSVWSGGEMKEDDWIDY